MAQVGCKKALKEVIVWFVKKLGYSLVLGITWLVIKKMFESDKGWLPWDIAGSSMLIA